MEKPAYRFKEWPEVRNLISDHLSVALKQKNIHSLTEIDITDLLPKLDEHLLKPSLTTYLAFVLANHLKDYPEMLAMRYGRKKLIVFEDVDMLMAVERRSKGSSFPIMLIIRGAQNKSLKEFQQEIKDAKTKDPKKYKDVKKRRALLNYPPFFRRWLFRRIAKDPFKTKQYYGNAAVTSLLVDADYKSGWGIPVTKSPVTLLPATLSNKAVFIDGKCVERKMLSITFTFNHDTIDGAPAKRFIRDFIFKVEDGYGL